MKNATKHGQLAALLTALLLCIPMTACGNQDAVAENAPAEKSVTESAEETDPAETTTAEADEKDASKTTAASKKNGSKTTASKEASEKDGSAKTTKTTAAKSGSNASDSGNQNASGNGNSSASGNNSSSGNPGHAGNTGNSGNNGNSGNSGNSGSGQSSGSIAPGGNRSSGSNGSNGSNGNQTAVDNPVNEIVEPENPDPAVTADDPEEETDPVKYIYLQDTTAQYSGDGITVNGNIITIGKGGTYEITGTLSNGQIYIMTDKKKVRLHFNNASITNQAGSAINCQNAKRLTLKSLPGTVNYLEDGGTHDLDKGTVFSEDTVYVKGEGVLNIKANYAHGIQSDDDIIVNGSTLNITAAKSCLHSNDGIEINGGNVFCDGGTNGIKTDGYITITGGRSVFLGGVREEKGAIYCDGTFTVTGGCFYAIGNTCTMPDAATTSANVIGMMFPSAQPANTVVNVTSGNNGIFTVTSPRQFKYVVYAGANLLTGAEYHVDTGGTVDGGIWENSVYNGGSYSYSNDCGNFIAGNTVTFYNVP